MMQMRTHTCNALRLADVGKSQIMIGFQIIGGVLAILILTELICLTKKFYVRIKMIQNLAQQILVK